MPLRRDIRALESLPLKLMVVAVVASMSIIPAAQALEGMRSRDYVRRAEVQLAEIVQYAEMLELDGPGNVRTVSMDFTTQDTARFSRLTIGDGKNGANMSCIILELRGGTRLIRTADQPPVWMCSSKMSSLTIDSPKFELRMTSVLSEKGSCVIVEGS